MLRQLLLPTTFVLLTSCGQAPTKPAPQPIVVTMASSAPSAALAASASSITPPDESAASSNDDAPNQKEDPSRIHQVALTLEPGQPPCMLELHGSLFQDHPEWFVITSVSRMATVESGGCASGVFYDVTKEKKADPNDMDPEPLVAGIFRKPGQTLPKDVEDGPLWNVTDDLNFDGIADLCVVVMTGAYNYSQKCWLFDKKSRTFVRHSEIDELIFMTLDAPKKKLKSSFRAGGPVYESNEYEWQSGRLVKTFQSISYFGEKPDGTPLNKGFSHWLIRYELRQGKLVKTFEGAIGDKP